MNRLRIALLNASDDDERTPRNFRRELDADLAEFDATAGEHPRVEEFDAAVVTGSRASVYWDEEWIRDLVEWTAETADRGLPMLGVCYGHQVLAEALGGRVAAMGEYEIGYRTVEHRGGRLFEGVDEEFLAFTTHGDEVAELPEGAEVLAENDYSVHAFRCGSVFGVQFHPEYDVETARELTRSKDLEPEREERVLAGITDRNYRRACEAKQVFDNFTEYVREQRAAATEAESAAGD